MMMKTVLKLGVNDDEKKKKVMATVCLLSGIDSFTMELKDKKLTVIGDIDPVTIVIELRKLCHTEIVSVGPWPPPPAPLPTPVAPATKKKPKKDEPKKDDESELVKAYKAYSSSFLQKQQTKIGEPKKDEPKNDALSDLLKAYKAEISH